MLATPSGGDGGDSDGGDEYLAMASLDQDRAASAAAVRPLHTRRSTIVQCCLFALAWVANLCRSLASLCACCRRCCGNYVYVNSRRYRVLRILGEGGFAQVFQVQAEDGQHRALKRMILQEPDQKALAVKEIRVHQQLGNACQFIMPLLDHEVVVVANGTREEALLVFPLFAGSLQDRLERLAPTGHVMDERDALARLGEICVATQRMHNLESPLAHRDIKPANVMVTEAGTAVLGDFGSAAPARVPINSRFDALNLQEEAAQYSSMPYRAPELFDIPSPGVVTPKTDVWSLGCTLYAMIYGYSPFECEFGNSNVPRVVECSHLRVLNPPQFPAKARVSPDCVALMKAMMTAEPSQRMGLEDVMDRLEAMNVRCPGRLARADVNV